ncbi:hypothetical protein BJV77DRAFT_62384 [Russula vinacea]|nr:hypothetical protein BJV77DRAFT_62384 [Russula vinacea]
MLPTRLSYQGVILLSLAQLPHCPSRLEPSPLLFPLHSALLPLLVSTLLSMDTSSRAACGMSSRPVQGHINASSTVICNGQTVFM